MTTAERIAENAAQQVADQQTLNEYALLLGAVIVGGLVCMVLWARCEAWSYRRRVEATRRHDRERRLRAGFAAWDADRDLWV